MIEIWHNPRCSKSRQTLALIADQDPKIRKYLEDAPTEAEIHAALEALGLPAAKAIRRGEKTFKELGLADATEDQMIAAMAAHPILIERPIVFVRGRAAIGRPPEAVLTLL